MSLNVKPLSPASPPWSPLPQPNGDDRLHQPVRPGLHGDSELTEVRQPGAQHQEQGGGEPGPRQPADQRAAHRHRPPHHGADGVQDGD